MKCKHCGADMSAHARVCPSCGEPVTFDATDEAVETTRLPQTRGRHARVEKTTVRPAAEPLAEPETLPVQPAAAPEPNPVPEPEPKRRPIGAFVALALVLVVAAAVLGMSLCSHDDSATTSTEREPVSQTEPAPYPTDDGAAAPTNTEDATNDAASDQATEGEAEVSPDNSRAGGPEDEGGAADLAAWGDTACAFMNVYPASYVQADGESGEPTALSLEDWAAACLQYVDPSSELGQQLQNDPAGVATPLGFYEAASYVSGTEVMSADVEGVVVQVTLEATQQDWEHTTSVAYTYLVQFGSNGLVTGVVDYS